MGNRGRGRTPLTTPRKQKFSEEAALSRKGLVAALAATAPARTMSQRYPHDLIHIRVILAFVYLRANLKCHMQII